MTVPDTPVCTVTAPPVHRMVWSDDPTAYTHLTRGPQYATVSSQRGQRQSTQAQRCGGVAQRRDAGSLVALRRRRAGGSALGLRVRLDGEEDAGDARGEERRGLLARTAEGDVRTDLRRGRADTGMGRVGGWRRWGRMCAGITHREQERPFGAP